MSALAVAALNRIRPTSDRASLLNELDMLKLLMDENGSRHYY